MVEQFCKIANIIVAVLLAAVGQQVLATPVDKWHKVNEIGNVFIEIEQKYNWFEAWNECAVRNMTLIAPDTADRNAALTGLLRKLFKKCPNLWIGGHDQGEEGKFIWISTGKRFEFTNWYGGNPDDYNKNEDCVHYWDVSDFEWNDVPCTTKLGFICEENRFLTAARRDLAIKRNFIEQLFAL